MVEGEGVETEAGRREERDERDIHLIGGWLVPLSYSYTGWEFSIVHFGGFPDCHTVHLFTSRPVHQSLPYQVSRRHNLTRPLIPSSFPR